MSSLFTSVQAPTSTGVCLNIRTSLCFLACFGVTHNNNYHVYCGVYLQLAGGGIVGLGIWMMMDPNIETYFNILNVDQKGTDFKMICYALLGVGAIGLCIAFMGCCGAMQRNQCMLTIVSITQLYHNKYRLLFMYIQVCVITVYV